MENGDEQLQAAVQSSVAPAGYQNSYPMRGYVQGAPGTRAMDDFYGTTQASSINTYPPQRQASSYAPSSYTSSNSGPQTPAPQHTLPSAAAYGSSADEIVQTKTSRNPKFSLF